MLYFYSYQILRSDTGAIVYQDDDFEDLGSHCMEMGTEMARRAKEKLASDLLSSFKSAWDYKHPSPYNYELQVHFVAFNYAGH